MGIGLGRDDEFFHGGVDEARFTDSIDFSFYDISSRLGGFLRLRHHPARGFNEMALCLYLPDGRTAFMSERSGAGGGAQLGAGGMLVEVIRPFEDLNVAYDGKLLLLEDPCALVHPERAYAENPQTDGTVRLTFSSLSPLYEDYGAPLLEGGPSIAGHYEQLTGTMGVVRVGEDRFDVDGLGLRGHGWGIHASEDLSYRRRLTANVGPSFGFMGFGLDLVTGARRRGGFVWDGTAFHICDDLAINTLWTGADSVHHGLDLTLKDGDQTWHARGTVVSLVVRRDDSTEDEGGGTRRISAGLTEWRLDDGQIGYGISEYVDRIIDGKPAGLAE
jgi:hypothetical protein